MDIKFKEVNFGIVEARAVIKLNEGIILNEITVLNRDGGIEIELPQKSFRAKTGKVQNIDIFTFETEDEKTLFLLQVKDAFMDWRKRQKKVRVFEQ